MSGSERKRKDSNFLQSRELLIGLISAFQHTGRLPTSEDIEQYTEYKAKHYKEQFGSLPNAYEESGLISSSSSERDSDDSSTAENTSSENSNQNQETTILDSIGEEFDSL